MTLVFVEEITNRITYTFDFIFKARGIDYELTTDQAFFAETSTNKLDYSSLTIGEKHISPSKLLIETTVLTQELSMQEFQGEECLAFDAILDPVASIFYILTRYEEYQLQNADEHGRFPFSESILKKYNWIEQAKCDRWANLIVQFIDAKLEKNKTEIIPTFDIDNTFAYRLKKGKQKNLSILKDAINLNINRLSERRRVLKGQVDPYDTFATIKNIASRFPSTKLFWLVGERAKRDRNIPLSDESHQQLIREMDKAANVNLHPSYASDSDSNVISKEKKALEKVLGHSVSNSRQHFLRLRLPKTFQALEVAGFTDEYSMGFAEAIGFRCGTARKHLWFDLSKNEVTKLTIHPFVYMDGTLNEYMKLSIEESKEKVKQLYNEVQKYGGDFIFLWHNETIGDYGIWKGWSEVLTFTLNLENE